MSLTKKQLLINTFNLPNELIDIVKDFAFRKINKIPNNDERYPLLRTIPSREYDPSDNTIYVYLSISEDKDYYLIFDNLRIALQTLLYIGDHHIHLLEVNNFTIQ